MTNQELYEKHSNQINKMAHSFKKTTSCNLDELISEGMAAMYEAHNNYDASKGCALSTVIHTYSFNAMCQYTNKEYKHTAVEPKQIASSTCGLEKRFEFMDAISHLGSEATEIVNIVLGSPSEVLGIALNSSPCKVRVAIKGYLKKLGYKKSEINCGFEQIKSILG